MVKSLIHRLTGTLSLRQRLAVRRVPSELARQAALGRAFLHKLATRIRLRGVSSGLLKENASTVILPSFCDADLSFLNILPPPDRRITTSIIIPVFNDVDFTFQCLQSLLREVDLATVEIIVVNDRSTDATEETLKQFARHIRIENNPQNMGFGEACNRGAAVAKGRYLVFLNNDTVVLPAWLSELERTVDEDETVGAAGSMFLYPDGGVQEAGAIIWRSGGAFHYGRGNSPDDRQTNFAREVDYCSAESLLIRRELFDRLDGFDPIYSPAYYEAADLCMGVRSLGFKVLYQPASRLIRYEGVAAGTDVGIGMNLERFREKWRSVLESSHSSESVEDLSRAADRRGPSVIIIDDVVPIPDRDAGSARMSLILSGLARGFRPVFVPVRRPVGAENESRLWRMGVETAAIADYPRLVKERSPAAVILSRPHVAEAVMPVLRRIAPSTKIILDLVDLSFLRLEREYELSGKREHFDDAKRMKVLEASLARDADLIWCSSLGDQRTIFELVPDTPSVVIPTIHPIRHHATPFDERTGIFFVGHMLHRPNVDSVRFLVDEIMPRVWNELPAAVVSIAGSGMTAEVEALSSERVRVLGHVPDLGPLFGGSRLMVAPLRFGAGINGKIGESMANGLPVVTTSLGAANFGIRHEQDALVADTAEGLAAAIILAYQDRTLWERLARNGTRLIEASFAPDVVEQTIVRSIRELCSPSK